MWVLGTGGGEVMGCGCGFLCVFKVFWDCGWIFGDWRRLKCLSLDVDIGF